MAFERVGGSMRLTLTSEAESPRIFETFEAVKPSSTELAQIAGEFRSEELQATYRIAARDGKLNVTVNWQKPFLLEPTVRDEFQGPGGIAVVFRRDASGHATGFDLFAGRVRNISFTRVEKIKDLP